MKKLDHARDLICIQVIAECHEHALQAVRPFQVVVGGMLSRKMQDCDVVVWKPAFTLANVGSRWLEHAPHSHRARIIIIRKQI